MIMSKETPVKKTLMTIAVLAMGGMMGAQAATAAPLSKAAGATQGAVHADVIQVRDRNRNGINDRFERRRNNKGYNNWRNDRRYYRYRNYNRYNSRPYNWRSRGCVAIGPVWFCK
jgi:Ni/Co efflux regulator RcnB